jgi:hypothetical protein
MATHENPVLRNAWRTTPRGNPGADEGPKKGPPRRAHIEPLTGD